MNKKLSLELSFIFLFLLHFSTDLHAQFDKGDVGFFIGPSFNVALVGQKIEGGFGASVDFHEAVSLRLGDAFGAEIGVIYNLENFFIKSSLVLNQSLLQTFQSRRGFVDVGQSYGNTLEARSINFTTSIGLAKSLNKKYDVFMSIGPHLGTSVIYFGQDISKPRDQIWEGVFWKIDGGYSYGGFGEAGFAARLSDNFSLITSVNLIYNIYKPARKEAESIYEAGELIPFEQIDKALYSKVYVDQPATVSFSSQDSQPIAQQYFNLSSLSFSVNIIYVL